MTLKIGLRVANPSKYKKYKIKRNMESIRFIYNRVYNVLLYVITSYL